MFPIKSPQKPTVIFDKPTGSIHSVDDVLRTLLIALRINFLRIRSDGIIHPRYIVLRECIPGLLPQMDERAISVMMSILTGCGKQVKVGNRWVDRGEFEFDTWVGGSGLRDYNSQESPAITSDWLTQFTTLGKPINVMR